jgi:cyclophilin family peptidyl-prolyl cis-trans isomerase
MKFFFSLVLLLIAVSAANAGQAIIVSGPQDLTIDAGSTANFVVTANGATSYQWVFQGTNITGATNAELNFSDVSTNKAGAYWVIVGGSAGSYVSNSANLTVLQGTIVNFQIVGFATGPSNVVVELFDHDKPMTVQNFVHYIYSGAYSNMFFDRLVSGFVLQGGSYAATNQIEETYATPITTSNTLVDIYDYYVTEGVIQYPTLPQEVPSEFYAGPRVSNQQGTIAMALPSGNVNGAANAFYFNLVDNPFLDVYTNGGGPYTVFGRVLSGADVLAYFNNTNYFFQPAFKTAPTHNIFSNGIYDEAYLPAASQVFGNLPVNFHGTNVPADSNLFYVNFSYPDTNALPVIESNLPTAAITFPPAGMILTNGIPLTVKGTAHDDVGVAVIYCDMVSYDGAYGDNAFGTYIAGTNNWSLAFGTLEPGVYQINVVPQDAAGLGPEGSGTNSQATSLYKQSLIITAVLTNGLGTVAVTNVATQAYASDAVGANLLANTNYAFGAQPGPGWFFANWSYGNNVSFSPNLTLKFTSNMVLTANFSAVLANGLGSVSATNLVSGAYTTNGIGANLLPNTNYAFGAQPAPGWFFVNWTYGTNISVTPNLTHKFTNNLVLTANFASNSVPNGIAFTNPPVGGNTTNGTFSIAGIVNTALLTPPVTVTCRLYSQTNQQLVGSVHQIKATNTWSFPVTNLGLGEYYALVTAQDALGQGAVITNDFSAGLLMTVLTNGGNGRGTVSQNYNGQFLVQGQHYSMTASAAGGSLFENWSIGVTNSANVIYTNNKVVNFTMTPGLVLAAAFVSNDFPGSISSPLAITNPVSGAKLTNQTFSLAGTINSSIASPVVSYQLFYGSNSVTPPSATNVVITQAAAPVRSAWSAGLTNLPPGYYTVVVTVSDASGHSTLVSESFQVQAQVLLQVSPSGFGMISSNWTTGQYVSPGLSYTVTAKTNGGYVFANWSNSVTGGTSDNNALSFVPTTNMTLTASFDTNYFYQAAGTYVGLFTNGLISPTNSGYFSVIVTSNGSINLTLKFPTLTLTSTNGQFPLYDPEGNSSVGFRWIGLDGKYVTNYFTLDLTNGTDSIIGAVFNAEFFSSLVAFRATPKLTAGSPVPPGTNIFTIPGDQPSTMALPGGDSYATFILTNNGVINLIGHLADNTSFSESTQIFASSINPDSSYPLAAFNYYGVPTNVINLFSTNAVWPFYASLYSGKGIAIGWETNTSPTNFAGAVAWSKPAKTGSYYTNAFLFVTNSSSFGYVPPVPGTHYQITFGGASFTNGLTNTLIVSTKGQFTNDFGLDNTNQLTLSLTTNGPGIGALSGSFLYPTAKVTHNFYGGFISPALGGSGYFLDTNSQTGWFQITEQ